MPRGGQEQYDADAGSETPASEASESTNDMQVNREGPPDSGDGGSYPTQEISSDRVADSRGNQLNPAGPG